MAEQYVANYPVADNMFVSGPAYVDPTLLNYSFKLCLDQIRIHIEWLDCIHGIDESVIELCEVLHESAEKEGLLLLSQIQDGSEGPYFQADFKAIRSYWINILRPFELLAEISGGEVAEMVESLCRKVNEIPLATVSDEAYQQVMNGGYNA